MKKYQVVLTLQSSANAGSKAPNDVRRIADKLGFEEIIVGLKGYTSSYINKVKNQMLYINEWKRIYNKIQPHSILLIQVPFYVRQFGRLHYLKKMKSQKDVKLIFIVHDIEELRGVYENNLQRRQFDSMLNLADIIIDHNKKMADFFIMKGYRKECLVNLDIFDYLCDYEKLSNKEISFTKTVIIAGNLDEEKTEYLKDLDKVDTIFSLYGPNFTQKSGNNTIYNGVVSSEKLPIVLSQGFGLIWDGKSIETCSGPFGNYLRYNNPHKLSLYLVSGLPVFIWKNAAEADFVIKNGLGYTINSLKEIPDILNNITQEEYSAFLKNVQVISRKLSMGWYTKQAITKALEIINTSSK
jgi:hypothetical protein